MTFLITAAMLAIVGVAAIVGGVVVWRSAETLVTDARHTLEGMFGDSHPELFADKPDPRGARIAAIAFASVGVVLLAATVVQVLSSR